MSRADGGLLAVHAHPDDETLTTGALLATWARAGRPVTVVTCTRGERGEVIAGSVPDGDLVRLRRDGAALAAHREGELARALAALGVTDHAFLDALPDEGRLPDDGRLADDGPPVPPRRYVDSGMVWLGPGRAGPAPDAPSDAFALADAEEAARRLAGLLVRRRPALVVTYEPGGGYGHPDHVAAHHVTMRAVELAAAAGVRPAVAWVAVPADGWTAALAAAPSPPEGITRPDPDAPPPSAVVPASEVDLLVDVRRVAARVVAALRAHATQVQAVTESTQGGAVAWFALSNAELLPVLEVEGLRMVREGHVVLPDGVRPPGAAG